jgi:hypothetical protein
MNLLSAYVWRQKIHGFRNILEAKFTVVESKFLPKANIFSVQTECT